MNRLRISTRHGFTLWELLVLIVVVGFLLMLMCPLQVPSIETARRMACTNYLKQIGLALHNYAWANKAFPPGTVCTSAPIQPANQYDVLAEAGQTGPGHRGTSFLLAILPYIEANDLAKAWRNGYGISDTTVVQGHSNFSLASTDIPSLYCPSRRSGIRPGIDDAMMLSPEWKGGGTDYGGCAGRHAAFTKETGYNLCDATMFYEPNFYPAPFTDKKDDAVDKRWGVFGRVNVGATFKDMRDGTSHILMTGELQRITDATPHSKDGWAIGGPATLFTTGALVHFDGKTVENIGSPKSIYDTMSNNHFYGSPGSDHANGANYGIADGSVRFISTSMDPKIFALLGSMADGETLPDDY